MANYISRKESDNKANEIGKKAGLEVSKVFGGMMTGNYYDGNDYLNGKQRCFVTWLGHDGCKRPEWEVDIYERGIYDGKDKKDIVIFWKKTRLNDKDIDLLKSMIDPSVMEVLAYAEALKKNKEYVFD